jgi:isoleucyl-tRNA synthetase
MVESGHNNKSDVAKREERILGFWQENKIFEKSLSQSEGKKEFVFYEGPPTANGKPGIHHLEARAFKDVIPRYKTMRGFHVRRKAGWDTHGLPVELEVEKELGFKSKKEIEDFGIAGFNKKCRESTWKYLDLWNTFTERIGYWLDQKNPYITYENKYIESVWNIFKKIDSQKLLYKDYKVLPWCPRCGTALSSHELAQGYEIVKDLSVYVKFKISSVDSTYILAWTTTPWTLPGNLALAVGKNIDYVKIKTGNDFLILAKAKLSIVDGEYEIVEKLKGNDLIGLKYEPLYPYLKNSLPDSEKIKLEKAYKVYEADFVNTEEGTGIVHTAVMYGQDDFELGTKIGLPKHHLVGLDGKFLSGTGFLGNRFVKDEDVAVDIIKDLAHRNLLFKKEKYEHSYPHCWRCHTALIYYARDSWYIRMSDKKIKEKLISENKKINWEPEYTKEGRFGEWLREVKDWAISRERYWGTPLPVWEGQNGERIIVGSIEDLKKYTKRSNNRYFILRHGRADHNVAGRINGVMKENITLTEEGKKKITESAEKLAGANITKIFSSPFLRTLETANLVKEKINFKGTINQDDRLKEMVFGDSEWQLASEYKAFFSSTLERFSRAPRGGENLSDVKKRLAEFIYDIDSKYQDETILIISHGDPLWMLDCAVNGHNNEEALSLDIKEYLGTGEFKELKFVKIPHNENYELDLHRPFIDDIVLEKDGKEFRRVKEVIDVWFDSGSMPFAQDHYPFENKKWVEGEGYPADYIAEAIDQTRGWFYTLHAIGILMGRGRAYKNVVCLGHLMDAKGKKMSKSIGNVVDPWIMMDKYGVDTLRLWMYSVNQPGESKNFDEKTVLELQRQVFGLLYNVMAFYELYRDKILEKNDRPKSKNILDIWILTRLDELTELTTKNLDSYKTLEPVRALRDFINDLSTWYLRRSRERIKEGDKEAKMTLYFVLKTLAKVMAPFVPFSAEDIWQKLKNGDDVESVHLESWPRQSFKLFSFGENKVIRDMATAREVVSTLLKERQQKNIPVRQSLNMATGPSVLNTYAEIIKEEINVKNYQGTGIFSLDTKITEELKQEGNYRELVRAIQDMRKNLGLTPSDKISLAVETDDKGKELIQKFETEMKKIILASKIEFGNVDGDEIKIDELVFKVKINKI